MDRGKEHLAYFFGQTMPPRELPRKFVIRAAGEHEFHLIVRSQLLEVSLIKGVGFAGVRALHIHDLDHLLRQAPDKTFAAGLDHHRVANREKLFRQRINLFLQQRLAAGQLHQRDTGRAAIGALVQPLHPVHHLVHAHLFPAVKRVRRVAPGAAQVAAGKPHENARQARARPFALYRFENFRDEHS